MKYGQKLKLGDAHVTPRNIQELQASKLGDAPRHPLFINKISGHLSRYYIFIASYDMRFLRASLFLLSVFFCFVCCNKWLDPNMFLLEKTHSVFIAKNILVSLLSFNECSLFLVLRLAFVFRLDFCSEIVSSLYLGVFRPLVFVGFHL
jgi:hypothetical protein